MRMGGVTGGLNAGTIVLSNEAFSNEAELGRSGGSGSMHRLDGADMPLSDHGKAGRMSLSSLSSTMS